MSRLGEQIAVLDGLDAFNPNDGRIGQMRASVTQYSRAVMPGVTRRMNVIDASEGANYSGGSSYHPRLPLMPSSVGLAGYSLGAIPSVLPTRRHVIDYSGGAQYSGGSSWVPGLPLLPSSSGLADDFIRGGYGRAGLGAGLVEDGYGRAGLGQTGSAADEDLAGAAEAVATERAYSPSDGRIGQQRAQVDEYGRPVMPGVLARSNVIDASEGANYSGGSSYHPMLPLMPSSVGLAGLGAYDELDGLSDAYLEASFKDTRAQQVANRMVSRLAAHKAVKQVVNKIGRGALTRRMKQAIRMYNMAKTARDPRMRAQYLAAAQRHGYNLMQIKAARRRLFSAAQARAQARGPSGPWLPWRGSR
jgi:hypothetical protein